MKRGWICAGVFAASALFACSSDTFSSAEDSGAPDGSFDGSTSDAATPADAGLDAGPGYCSLHPEAILCADFDESLDPARGWSGVNVGDAGGVSTSTTGFVSPPNALKAAIAPAGPTTNAFIYYAYPAPMVSAKVELDVAVSGGAPQAFTVLGIDGFTEDGGLGFQVSLDFALSASDYDAVLGVSGGADGGFVECTLMNATTANISHHYAISFANPNQLTLIRSDVGSDSGVASCSLSLALPPTPGGEAFSVGVTGNAPTTVYVDNLLVTPH